MTTKRKVANNATNDQFANPDGTSSFNTVTYAGPVDGTATAGTITIICKAPASTNYETPKDSGGNPLNTIDIAAPEKLNIPGHITSYDITVAGFTGTATEIELGFTSYE